MGQSQLRKSKKECLELMRNERFKESLEILENLEKSNLKNKSEVSEFVNFQRGLCYMALKQNREAIQCFEKCNSKQSKINIGLMKIKLDKLEEAKTYFENLIRDSKYQNNPYLLQLYGYCILVGDKDYHKSAQIFEQSVTLDNKLFTAYHNLALCYSNMRDVEKALYFLDKSLSINPNFKLSLDFKKNFYASFVDSQVFNDDNFFEIQNILEICKKINCQQEDNKIIMWQNLIIFKKLQLHDIFINILSLIESNLYQYDRFQQSSIFFTAGFVLLALNKYSQSEKYFKLQLQVENLEVKIKRAIENIALCLVGQRNFEEAIRVLLNQKERQKSQIFLLCIYLCQNNYLQFFKNLQNDSIKEFRNVFIFYILQKFYLDKDVQFIQKDEDDIFIRYNNQQFLLGKLSWQYLSKEYCKASSFLLMNNQQIDIQQRFQGFDCLYYSYHLIRCKAFLHQKPSEFHRNINQDDIIQQNIYSGVTVSKITINQNQYLKKEFKLVGQGELFSYIPQWLINELLIGSFCLGRYLNYNLFYDYYLDQYKNSYVTIYSNYYEEGSLSKYLQNNKLIKFQKQQIAFKIIKGLQQLHSHSINHLDLKIQNIVIQKSQSGEQINPIIIDFGASVVNLNPLNLIYAKKQENIAFQQIQFHTPSYRIPEDEVDSRSDIFNLGKIILEIYSNSGLGLLQDFQIDTSLLKKDEISNQLLRYIQEEIRNKNIIERPDIQLILYQFQKDYLFDLIYSCLIDQSLVDYQFFMTSMYSHFQIFWIEMFQGQTDQQQIRDQQSQNFILENKQLFCIFKVYQLVTYDLFYEISFNNNLLYYFIHGVLHFLPFEKDDLGDLINKIQLKKKISQLEDYQLKQQIELERKLFKDLISQINKKQNLIHENQFTSLIQEEQEEIKEGVQTQGYQYNNQYYADAVNQIKQQITDDYIQNQLLKNLRTTQQKFQQNEINFQNQDITQTYFLERTYDYFKK